MATTSRITVKQACHQDLLLRPSSRPTASRQRFCGKLSLKIKTILSLSTARSIIFARWCPYLALQAVPAMQANDYSKPNIYMITNFYFRFPKTSAPVGHNPAPREADSCLPWTSPLPPCRWGRVVLAVQWTRCSSVVACRAGWYVVRWVPTCRRCRSYRPCNRRWPSTASWCPVRSSADHRGVLSSHAISLDVHTHTHGGDSIV